MEKVQFDKAVIAQLAADLQIIATKLRDEYGIPLGIIDDLEDTAIILLKENK